VISDCRFAVAQHQSEICNLKSEIAMHLHDLIDLLKSSAVEWWNDNVFRLASSLAFYTIFSLAPVLVIAVAVGGLIFVDGSMSVREGLANEIANLVGAEGGKAVEQVLGSASMETSSPTAAVVGILTVLAGSTFVFAELQSALNQIWDVQADPTRGMIRAFLRDRLRSFGIALAVGFLLIVSLIASTALNAAQDRLDAVLPGAGWLWRALNAVTWLILVAILFAMIYKYLPDVRITWRDVAIGAVVTACLFSVGKYVIGLYLGRMAFGTAYGGAGSFVVFLIWIYYSALICFFGAEFTQVFARRYGSKIRPQAHAVRVGRKKDDI
jgi:membrane protein